MTENIPTEELQKIRVELDFVGKQLRALRQTLQMLMDEIRKDGRETNSAKLTQILEMLDERL